MLICADGTTAGSLSGGCLEEEVARRAFDVLRTGRPSLMSFDTRLRFGCNGTIEIFVEAARENFLAELARRWSSAAVAVTATVFAGTGRRAGQRILSRGEDAPAGAFVQEIQPPDSAAHFWRRPGQRAASVLRRNSGLARPRGRSSFRSSRARGRADRRRGQVAQLRTGFRRPPAFASAEPPLRRPARPTETARPIGQRPSGRWCLDRLGTVRAGWFRSRRGNAGGNRARHRFGNPVRFRRGQR